MGVDNDIKTLREETERLLIKANEAIFESKWLCMLALMRELDCEPYIDDQIQIDEIWQICASIIKQINLAQLSMDFKKNVWCRIVSNYYYDKYGVYDPMHDLAYAMIKTEEEELVFALVLACYKSYEDAAVIYKKYDYLKEYTFCMKKLLAKDSDPYRELIDYYEQHGMHEEAMEIANMTLKLCRDRGMTDIFLFLVKDAYVAGNMEKVAKLVKSTKLRSYVNDKVIAEWLEEQTNE